MFELIKESDLDTVRHFYRALAGTEFCAWTDIYPGGAGASVGFFQGFAFLYPG